MTKYLLAMAAVFSVLTANAQKAAIVGMGTHSCGSWLEARSKSKGLTVTMDNFGPVVNSFGMTQWVHGYVSGINATRLDRNREAYNLPDYASVEAFMDKSCADNPLQNIYQVALALQLAVRRMEQQQGRGKD